MLEAMACSKPVVAAEIAGPANDISKSRAGIIVIDGDEKGPADAIYRHSSG